MLSLRIITQQRSSASKSNDMLGECIAPTNALIPCGGFVVPTRHGSFEWKIHNNTEAFILGQVEKLRKEHAGVFTKGDVDKDGKLNAKEFMAVRQTLINCVDLTKIQHSFFCLSLFF
jgi:hypothetical protein